MSALTWWQQVVVVYTAAGLPLAVVVALLLGRAIGRNEAATRLVYGRDGRDGRVRGPVHGSTRWDSEP